MSINATVTLSKGHVSRIKGKNCISKNNIRKYVSFNEISDYIRKGWKLGYKK